MKWYNHSFSYIIIIANAIPLIGYAFANWSMIDIFLFYSIELCWYQLIMLPKIVIYSNIAGFGFGDVLGKSAFYIFIHLLLFALAFHFLVGTAVIAVSDKESYTWGWVFIWIKHNWVFAAAIGFEYLYSFFKYLRKKEYKKIPEEEQLKEIALFHLFLMAPIGLASGLIIGLGIDLFYFQMFAMLFIIFLKTATQISFRIRKERKFR